MDYTVSYQTYGGALATTQLLSNQQTILLGDFGPMNSGSTLTDDDGTLNVGEQTTIDSTTYTMLGSGTAQPGADVGGVIVPTGDQVDLLLLEDTATGELIFVYPEGEPDLTGAVALVVDINEVGYDLDALDPLCFTAGTLIDTPDGPVEIETLCEGDEVLDIYGTAHKIRWISSRRIPLANGGASNDRLRPVLIRKNALGPGEPYLDTRFSPQHRVYLQSAHAELLFGHDSVLMPAKTLVNGTSIKIDHESDSVEYFHILCEDHVVLRANGLPAESLLPVWAMVEKLPAAAREELLMIFPEIHGVLSGGRACYPVLKKFEAQLFCEMHFTNQAQAGAFEHHASAPSVRG